MPQGLIDHPTERQWLLVADHSHLMLYWLQCISNSRVAVPVVSITDFDPEYRLTITPSDLDDLKVKDRNETLALAPVRIETNHFSIDMDLPIVISAESIRGRQLRNDQYQPIQRLMSEPLTALPECA